MKIAPKINQLDCFTARLGTSLTTFGHVEVLVRSVSSFCSDVYTVSAGTERARWHARMTTWWLPLSASLDIGKPPQKKISSRHVHKTSRALVVDNI